jgi:hypothetical protein
MRGWELEEGILQVIVAILAGEIPETGSAEGADAIQLAHNKNAIGTPIETK